MWCCCWLGQHQEPQQGCRACYGLLLGEPGGRTWHRKFGVESSWIVESKLADITNLVKMSHSYSLKKKKKFRFFRSSLVLHQIKDLALSRLWCEFDPWPGSFLMPCHQCPPPKKNLIKNFIRFFILFLIEVQFIYNVKILEFLFAFVLLAILIYGRIVLLQILRLENIFSYFKNERMNC